MITTSNEHIHSVHKAGSKALYDSHSNVQITPGRRLFLLTLSPPLTGSAQMACLAVTIAPPLVWLPQPSL